MVTRCKTTDSKAVEDVVITSLRQRLSNCNLEGHQRAQMLNDLAVALSHNFLVSKELGELEEAFELHQQALQSLAPNSPLRNMFIQHYAATQQQLKQLLINDEARLSVMTHFRATLHARPPGSPLRDVGLDHLGHALWVDFERSTKTGLLEEASSLLQEALMIRGPDHPLRDVSLQNLSSVFCYQNKLDEAIHLLRNVLALRPVGHPLRDMALNNLAVVLMQKFQKAGMTPQSAAEIEELNRQSLDLRPKGHPLRDTTLQNLSFVLFLRFKWTSDSEILQEAVALCREALSLRPPGHYRRGPSLEALAECLLERFEHYGDARDLEDAITFACEAVDQSPPESVHHISAVVILASIHTAKGEIAAAISLYRKVIASVGPQDLCGQVVSQNLADCLVKSSQMTGSLKDISEATHYYREIIRNRAGDHAHYACALERCGRALHTEFGITSDVAKREEAVALYRQALEMAAAQNGCHLEKATVLHHLARILLTFDSSESWNEALQHVAGANRITMYAKRNLLNLMSTTIVEMEAALTRMGIHNEQYSLGALEAYIGAVKLLPQAAHLGLDMASQLRELTGLGHICHIAAIRALLLSRGSVAFEVLEEGRALFWMQSLRLRATALDTLDPEEANRLRKLFLKLERGRQTLGLSEAENKVGLDHLLVEQDRLNTQVHQMIQEIRARPGMQTFMSIEPFVNLAQSAAHGLVVLLLASDAACFAVALLNTQGDYLSMPLHRISPGTLHSLRARTQGSNICGRGVTVPLNEEAEDRLGLNRRQTLSVDDLPLLLAELWTSIVGPIIDSLALKRASGRNRPRLHWCPVGEFAFLPLHAAGVYRGQDPVCVSDFVVSSYTPSLSSLIQTRSNFSPIRRSELKALLVSESAAANRPILTEVVREVQAISSLLEMASVQHSIDMAPAVQTVLEKLPGAHFVHMACHGLQQPDALESYFALHDGPLTIAALMKVQLPNALLAFLSACETAKGDQHQPDQAVHLAACMLFCGFRSVIGTMWEMNDNDGPLVAEATYSSLLSRELITLDDIPYALDSALQMLRKQGVPANRWATFVHMGA